MTIVDEIYSWVCRLDRLCLGYKADKLRRAAQLIEVGTRDDDLARELLMWAFQIAKTPEVSDLAELLHKAADWLASEVGEA